MQEYRLEFWRIDAVNNKQKKISETDFKLDKMDDDLAKKHADKLAAHYEPAIEWYDWRIDVHPILRQTCYSREVKNQTEQCIEFIVLYWIYPFQYRSQIEREKDNKGHIKKMDKSSIGLSVIESLDILFGSGYVSLDAWTKTDIIQKRSSIARVKQKMELQQKDGDLWPETESEMNSAIEVLEGTIEEKD